MIRANNAHGARLDAGVLSITLPPYLLDPASILITQSRERWGGYLSLTLDRPKKPRTTGPKSQCAHLHGHLQTIAQYTGHSMGEIKYIMKADCNTWPYKTISIGGKWADIPVSESEVDTVVESAAIEWCHVTAAEIGCTLIEE
jgi:hypothetical protein